MATPVVAIHCPHCRKAITVPTEYLGQSLRCKSCNKVFAAQQEATAKAVVGKPVAHKPAPAKVVVDKPKIAPVAAKPVVAKAVVVSKPPPPPTGPESYAQRMAKQQRTSTKLFLGIALIAIVAIAAGLLVFKDQIFARLLPTATQPVSSKPAVAVVAGDTPLLKQGEVVDKTEGDLTQLPPPDKRNKRNLARIPAPYPGRALLIGVRNYLYLNPLNPGYRAERSFLGDPLGILSLRRNLITEMSFPRDQVLVLSDIDDQKPVSPTKETIEATVAEFCSTCKPPDRMVLVLAVHAAWLDGKVCLVPVDGELPADGAKPDAERDAKLAKKMITLPWLYEKLAACKARQKVVILDIAQIDPEAGIIRNAPGALDEAMLTEIKKLPEGVQVWLPCQAKQYSMGLSSSGQSGTAFLDTLNQFSTLSVDRNWKLIESLPALKTGTLPLLLLEPAVAQDTAKYAKAKGYDQTPLLLGKEAVYTGSTEPVPGPVTLKIVNPTEALVTGQEIALVLKESGIENDLARRLIPSSFPPLLQSAFKKYQPDYAKPSELEEKLSQWPLRGVTLKAIKVIDRSLKTFKMRFAEEKDENAFKKKIEKEQESPAYVLAELTDLLEEMKKLDEKRDQEKSPRWQAHFDYTQARLLAQMAYVQEYSFVLGNKLRKDTPKLKDKANHNGWMIVPQRKLEQKETRTFDAERQKLLTKIIKEHPSTPWEVLAKREQATILGLALQETYLEEYKK